MNMKKILRSGLAIICSVSMVLSCFGMIAPTVKAAETMPADFTEVTPQEFGIDDFTGDEKTLHESTLEPLASMDKVKLTANMVFGADSTLYYCRAKDSLVAANPEFYTYGMGFKMYTDGRVRFYNYIGDSAIYAGGKYVDNGEGPVYQGGTSSGSNRFYDFYVNSALVTKNVVFSLTTEIVDFDLDGTKDDIKIGLWFDDVLQNNQYLYIRNVDVEIESYLNMTVKSSVSPIMMPKNFYTDVTPQEFGIDDFTGDEKTTHESTLEPLTSMDKVKLTANMVFGADSTLYYCRAKDSLVAANPEFYTYGMGFKMYTDGRVRFYNYIGDSAIYAGGKYVDNGEGPVYQGGTSSGSNRFYDFYVNSALVTKNVVFSLTTEIVDFDLDGTKDDLKIGLWFDDVVQNNQYLYVRNVDAEIESYLNITVKSSVSPILMPKNFYTDVTPREFGIGDFTGDEKTTHESTLEPLTSMDKVKLTANMVFGADSTLYYCRAKDSLVAANPEFYTYGMGFKMYTDGRVRFYNYIGDSAIYAGGKYVDNGEEPVYQGGTSSGSNRFYDFYLNSEFVAKNVVFSLTTEIVDFDLDGTKDDLKIGLWFDDVVQNNQYLYVRNVDAEIESYLKMTVQSCASPEISTDHPANPTVYGELTPEMLGVANATATTEGITTSTPTESVKTYNLDETKFNANLKYDSAAWSAVTYLYNAAGRGQLKLAVAPGSYSSLLVYNCRLDGDDTTLYVGNKYETGANIEESYTKIVANSDSSFHIILGNPTFSFLGNEFLLSVTTEFVDFDGDGNEDDLEIGIWINGDTYEPTYCYFKDYEETTFQGILKTENLKAISSPDVTNPAEPVEPTTPPGTTDPEEATLPTDFTEVAPNFFDIDDFKDNVEDPITYQNTKTPFTSADKVMLYADVVFGNGRTIEYLYNGTTGSGIYLWAKDNLHVRNYMSPSDSVGMYIGGEFVNGEYKGGNLISGRHDNYVIKVSEFSTTENFDTLKVSLILTTEFVDFDGEGTANDLKLGVWIGGKLYDNTYIYMRNCLDEYTPALKMNVVEMSSPISTGSGEKEDTVPVLPEITFSDFDIDDGTYGYNKEKPKDFAISGSYKEGFANQTFVGTVKFTDQPATHIIFAGKTSAWKGVSIVSRGDGNLSFSDANKKFPTVVIYEKLAKTTLTDRDMEIALTFEVTDLDGDGTKDDVRFWLTLDGVLYRNKPIVKAIDYAQYLGKFMGIYSDHEASSVTIASKDIQRPVQEVDFSIMGFTKDWEKTLNSGSKNAMNGVSGNKAPYTADNTNYTNYITICILAFVMLGGACYIKGYGKKETD